MSNRNVLKSRDLTFFERRRPTPLSPARLLTPVAEEALVVDARAGLTPSQAVERKLAVLLKGQPVPVSHLLSACRARQHG